MGKAEDGARRGIAFHDGAMLILHHDSLGHRFENTAEAHSDLRRAVSACCKAVRSSSTQTAASALPMPVQSTGAAHVMSGTRRPSARWTTMSLAMLVAPWCRAFVTGSSAAGYSLPSGLWSR